MTGIVFIKQSAVYSISLAWIVFPIARRVFGETREQGHMDIGLFRAILDQVKVEGAGARPLPNFPQGLLRN